MGLPLYVCMYGIQKWKTPGRDGVKERTGKELFHFSFSSVENSEKRENLKALYRTVMLSIGLKSALLKTNFIEFQPQTWTIPSQAKSRSTILVFNEFKIGALQNGLRNLGAISKFGRNRWPRMARWIGGHKLYWQIHFGSFGLFSPKLRHQRLKCSWK